MIPILIHLHVPKCAGVSVNRALGDHFRPRVTGMPRDGKGRERWEKMTREERDERWDCVFGHLSFGTHRHFTRPPLYISATRDPVARICSFFNFLHTRPDHPMHAHMKATLRDLNELTSHVADERSLNRLWNNEFCRVYSGRRELPTQDTMPQIKRRVVRNVRVGQMFIAPLSDIHEFLVELGIPEIGRHNVTDLSGYDDFEPASPENLTPAAKALIEDRFCRFDYDLFEVLAKRVPKISGAEVARRSGLAKSWA